jgi:hypothetical protein
MNENPGLKEIIQQIEQTTDAMLNTLANDPDVDIMEFHVKFMQLEHTKDSMIQNIKDMMDESESE